MDDLNRINLSQSNIADQQDTNLMEDRVMEPVKKNKVLPIVIIVGILLGLGSGFFLAQKRLLLAGGSGTSILSTKPQELTSSTSVKVGDVFGSADEKTFRDQAEGILMAGGIDGEGSQNSSP